MAKRKTLKKRGGGGGKCKKYFNKTVRGTPKNWAYRKCLKNPERCQTLPPAGYGMYRYFCE
jgi:hypothetical protein